MRRHTWMVAGSMLALVTALGGCKKKAPPAPPPAAVEAPPPAPPPLAFASVELGKGIGPDKKVLAPVIQFGLRDTIYASVATTGVAAAATVTAKWTFQTGQTVDSTSIAIAPTGPANTEFHITKKSAWPVGKYKVAIMLNGALAGEREFEVKK